MENQIIILILSVIFWKSIPPPSPYRLLVRGGKTQRVGTRVSACRLPLFDTLPWAWSREFQVSSSSTSTSSSSSTLLWFWLKLADGIRQVSLSTSLWDNYECKDFFISLFLLPFGSVLVVNSPYRHLSSMSVFFLMWLTEVFLKSLTPLLKHRRNQKFDAAVGRWNPGWEKVAGRNFALGFYKDKKRQHVGRIFGWHPESSNSSTAEPCCSITMTKASSRLGKKNLIERQFFNTFSRATPPFIWWFRFFFVTLQRRKMKDKH